MSSYQQRKAERTAAFNFRHGRKLATWTACNGSGRYDNTGSPPCWSCDGTGRELESLPREASPVVHWRDALLRQTSLVTARRQIRLGVRQ